MDEQTQSILELMNAAKIAGRSVSLSSKGVELLTAYIVGLEQEWATAYNAGIADAARVATGFSEELFGKVVGSRSGTAQDIARDIESLKRQLYT